MSGRCWEGHLHSWPSLPTASDRAPWSPATLLLLSVFPFVASVPDMMLCSAHLSVNSSYPHKNVSTLRAGTFSLGFTPVPSILRIVPGSVMILNIKNIKILNIRKYLLNED